MKRRQIATILALLSLTQNMAHANVIVDLPDPTLDDGGSFDVPLLTPEVPSAPTTQAQPQSPVQTEYTSSLKVSSMTRQSGGGRYQVGLQSATTLSRLELTVLKNRIKLHSAAVITEKGQRISIREFTNSEVIGTSSTLVSENLNLRDRVVAVELIAESYSGNADISLTAISQDSVPKMLLLEKPAEQVASTPTPPPPPPPPSTPRYNNCLGEICVGKTMMYDYTTAVTVVSIDNSNRINVRFSNGQTYSVAPQSLTSKATCINNICEGHVMMYDFTTEVTVLEVYKNNTAQVRFNNGAAYVTGLSNLTKKVSCVSNICVGQELIYNFTDEVTVVSVHTNNTASVKFKNGGTYSTALSNLSKKINCISNICTGQVMMYDFTTQVTVTAVYANQTAMVKFPNGALYSTPISNLTNKVNCVSNICAGQIKMYDHNTEVTVLEVYSNKTALLKFPNGSNYTVAVSNLTEKVNCVKNICAGSMMMYDYVNPVTVESVFTNNIARVRFPNGARYDVNLNTLSGQIKCMDGLCAGDKAIYDGHTSVKVLEVYSNRTAKVSFQGSGSYIVGLSTLRKTR